MGATQLSSAGTKGLIIPKPATKYEGIGVRRSMSYSAAGRGAN